MIEHRCSKRIPARLQVRVFQQGTPVASGKSRNLNLEGIYVVTDTERFHVGAYLELEVSTGAGEPLSHLRIPGMVVHCSGQGMGVMFVASNPHLAELIRRIKPGTSVQLARQAS